MAHSQGFLVIRREACKVDLANEVFMAVEDKPMSYFRIGNKKPDTLSQCLVDFYRFSPSLLVSPVKCPDC
jgi:hypothetical protein